MKNASKKRLSRDSDQERETQYPRQKQAAALASPETFFVICGVTLAVAASFLVCLGLALQKVSLCTPGNEHVSPLRQPKWVAGFVCMLLGNILDFFAFGMAPQSLLAPLAALSLVWNLYMSSYMLEESYDRNDINAVALIFLGTAITVIFSNHHEQGYTLDTLRELYRKPRMYVYFIIVPLLLGLHYYLIHYVSERNLQGTFWKLLELTGWCGFAGITGGQSVLFAKSTVELLKDAAQGDDVFLHLDTYLIICAMVACLLTQITFLNGAMKRFDQLYVMPMYQSYWIISGVVGGLVYFGEWEESTTTQINMFVLGTCITLSGLVVLTRKENHSLNSTGPQPGFDVLPSRKLSADSAFGFVTDSGTEGGGAFDDESENEDFVVSPESRSRRVGDRVVELGSIGVSQTLSPRGSARLSSFRKLSNVSSVGSMDSEDARRRSSSHNVTTVDL
ncbi:Magnesium transporter NIPA2 [Hondaea fermentalgiana]|uniref:Magnesium transporter NIPA2 n=1 Tax=Hondaea fermentalgiana TaxID=2315210 RepID=A0A2R5GRD2_9STRA|nr:Magnesium transporter NIPA2 [Hondaea fermentalgiana]|eukprot:GBG32869.1 Magnesium transporter NIPA2 [Hondaea fermentalgiana]